MRRFICALVIVSFLSVSGVAQDCAGGTCNKPVRHAVTRVVSQPVQVVTSVTQRATKVVRGTVRKGFGLFRGRSCGCVSSCCN